MDAIIPNNNKSNPTENNPKQSSSSIHTRHQTQMNMNVKNWGSREERLNKRNLNKNIPLSTNEVIESCFVDWTNHKEEEYYYSYTDNTFIIFENDTEHVTTITPTNHNQVSSNESEICYKAVTEGVPRNLKEFQEILPWPYLIQYGEKQQQEKNITLLWSKLELL